MGKIRKIFVVFILIIFITGCNKSEDIKTANKSKNNNVNNNEKYTINHINDIGKKNLDYSKYYLQCNREKNKYTDYDTLDYFDYYFDKDGNTRKACHSNQKLSKDGSIEKSINDCNMKIIDNYNTAFKIAEKNVKKEYGNINCKLFLTKEELNTKYDYNLDEFPKIKETTNLFLNDIERLNLNYMYLEYENSVYTNGTYKTVKIVFGKDDSITLKFDNDQNLMLSTYNHNSSSDSSDYSKVYMNSSLIFAESSYYNFTNEESNKLIETWIDMQVSFGSGKAGNYSFEGYKIGSQTLFTIQDNRYANN